MNKKHLSVVMAGAMLASSVAPVLAEVVKEEVSANELGLLQKEIRELINSKVYSNVKENNPGNGKEDLRGKSVYYITVNGKATGLDTHSKQEDYQRVFNDISAGETVYVWSKGFVEKDNKVLGYEHKDAEIQKYTKEDLKAEETRLNDLTKTGQTLSGLVKEDGVKYDETTGELVIEFKGEVGLQGITDEYNTITIKVGDQKLRFLKYYDKDGKEKNVVSTTTPGDFYGFVVNEDPGKPAENVKIPSSKLKEISITAGGYDLAVEDLYDGLMLTTKGHDFFTKIKEAKAMGRTITINGNNTKNPTIKTATNAYEYNIADAIKMVGGKAKFTIEFGAKGKLAAETYVITGLNEENTERLASWMIKPLARVDILAGDNRYETAAKIAEEYAELTGNKTSTIDKADIVLVNGNALVDGLAASPLAAKLSNDKRKAPILLTEADHLPKATKAYFQKVLKNVQVGNANKVKIHLVGGETVLNKSLERELKGLGFSVERYGGANREETSLEVMKAMGSKNEAFVVGANGEADAMSIAAVASSTKTPIVVAANNGISEDATYDLKGKKVTIIGGKTVVSATDEKAIKAEAKGVLRIAGSNRKETNAQIIEKYYKNSFIGEAKNVIVAKDGQRNKMELVDALAAANMASVKNAPIVLATDKISKSQENALELNAKKSFALYQVGHGVAREVVKTIAENLGLSNR